MTQTLPTSDWHPADINAALKKRGTTLRAVSVAAGFHKSAGWCAARKPWLAMEQAIAAALGIAPQTIWPSRYHPDGRPLSRHPGVESRGDKSSTRAVCINVYRDSAA